VELAASWKSVFESWPVNIPHVGMLVTSGQETIPFVDFLLGDGFVIVERDKPDSSGARKVIVSLAAITAVKLSNPDSLSTLQGFVGEEDFGARAAAALRRTGSVSQYGR
jgi:hypothetical protein